MGAQGFGKFWGSLGLGWVLAKGFNLSFAEPAVLPPETGVEGLGDLGFKPKRPSTLAPKPETLF